MAISLSRATSFHRAGAMAGRSLPPTAGFPQSSIASGWPPIHTFPYVGPSHPDSGWRTDRVIWHNDCLSANWAPLAGLFRGLRNQRA